MSTNISRRKVVAGAAWAAPVVAASAAVPAFASSTECEYASAPKFNISGQPSGAKDTVKFTVPAKVDKIKFEVAGGAGGGSNQVAGGSGALVTGVIPVKEGQVIELVAASGGVAYLESVRGVDSPALWQTRPATGGKGYGNGGDVNEQPIPADVKAQVDANWSKPSDMKRYLYGGSGGGSSALIINGTPVAVAGGGGGAGIRTQPGTNNMPSGKYYNPKAVDASTTRLSDPDVKSVLPAGASASAATGDSAETSVSHYTVLKPHTTAGTAMKVAGGNGGGNGQGGAGGEQPLLYKLANVYGVLGFTSQNKQELFSSATAGDKGGSGFDGKGADGVFAYSYQIDNNDISKLEIVHATNPVNLNDKTNLDEDSTRKSFNGYQTVVSAGGGAGYGGGGSGAARGLSSIITSQKWNGNEEPTRYRQNVSALLQAGAGGAGGSYVAPSVTGGAIASANNAAKESGVRNPGYVKVYLCERS
ncbi:transcriptional initiation protein Tat [Rothia sp. HMSC066H02]|uniref:transcriptional initiation protein Tat n=1 Tax=unclassified Rothia (in: high G+C Gram-positive bacteria) TaxID=2689056 RepID=UPI0008A12C40|nr:MULTISPECIES: transcriptional initiation protein Tat [unclassified Rothia (in: high G+C Gram-positive bacteria)]OFO96823.1 transcriptional initiation protein Tat [Rothia sp. HMSC065D09]OFP13651.1 transcriptional initiation protein Tat [Rothia sp. HMSC066H02]